MPRELISFECNDCRKWFMFPLNLQLEEDVLVECPNCGRQHPRTLSKGEMTGKAIVRIYEDGTGPRMERNSKEGKGQVIIGLKSTLSDKKPPKDLNPYVPGRHARWLEKAAKEKNG